MEANTKHVHNKMEANTEHVHNKMEANTKHVHSKMEANTKHVHNKMEANTKHILNKMEARRGGGGEHPPTGIQTQVGGCWGWKFLQKCVKKQKFYLKMSEKS